MPDGGFVGVSDMLVAVLLYERIFYILPFWTGAAKAVFHIIQITSNIIMSNIMSMLAPHIVG